MPTTLSSRTTPFYKFIIPVLTLGALGAGAWVAYLHPEPQKMPPGLLPDQGWMLMVGVAVLVAGILWWTVGRLMRVELDDDELIVSNYRTEIRVPLSSVVQIGGPTRSNPPRYTLTFDEPTELGRRVSFIAPMVWTLLPRGEPEEVTELRRAWEAARSKSGKGC